MDLTQLANLGEFIGGVAVLVTLVYLAIQVKQNTGTLRSAAIQTVISDYRTKHLHTLLSDADLMSLFTRGLTGVHELSDEERPRFMYVLLDLVLQAQTALELHQRRTLSREDYEVWIEGVAAYFRCPGAKQCWNEFKWAMDPEISHALSEKLAEGEGALSVLAIDSVSVAAAALTKSPQSQ